MRPRGRGLLLLFLAMAGVGVLGVAAYLEFAPLASSDLQLADTDIEIADCIPGQKRAVVIRVDNNLDHPTRILGMEEC